MNNKKISIVSTEIERAEILKIKTLTIVPSIPELELEYDEEDSIRDTIVDFAYRLNLIGKEIHLPDYPIPIKISEQTITESLHIMKNEHARLFDLPLLLPILQEVSQNAIKMQVEPYRHNNGKWSHINGIHQYMSAFYNPENNMLYPVKITVQERVKSEEDSIYMTITVGHFNLEQIKKKDLPTLRSPDESEKERSHGESSLLRISLAELISKLNSKTTIFIKNLPNELLSSEQIKLKRDTIIKDIQKEGFEVNDDLVITKIKPSAIYPNENRIVVPYTVKGIEQTAFDEINVSKVNIFIGNKHKVNLNELNIINVTNKAQKIKTILVNMQESNIIASQQIAKIHNDCVSVHNQVLEILEQTKNHKTDI